MFAVIKRFLGGLFGRKQTEPPPAPPHDPYAYRTAPHKRGPYERGGAVAVLEPDDDEQLGSYPFENVFVAETRHPPRQESKDEH